MPPCAATVCDRVGKSLVTHLHHKQHGCALQSAHAIWVAGTDVTRETFTKALLTHEAMLQR